MVLYLSFVLEGMDVVGRIPHPNPTQPDAVSDAVARVSVPRLSFFFSRIRTNSAQFTPNRADSTIIGPYRPYRVISTDDRNGLNRPKSALNLAGTAAVIVYTFYSSPFHCYLRCYSICISVAFYILNS